MSKHKMKASPYSSRIARSIKIMNIKHAVLTSVDRDDLKDMGSILWAETVNAVRRMNPQTTLETLIPDFQGIEKDISDVCNCVEMKYLGF